MQLEILQREILQWVMQLVTLNAGCVQKLAIAMLQMRESQLAFWDREFLAEVDLPELALRVENEVDYCQVRTLC